MPAPGRRRQRSGPARLVMRPGDDAHPATSASWTRAVRPSPGATTGWQCRIAEYLPVLALMASSVAWVQIIRLRARSLGAALTAGALHFPIDLIAHWTGRPRRRDASSWET
jgi:hypothetical protein